jgi:hypothetical protein
MTGFHLASVFDGERSEAKGVETMVTLAKTQFGDRSKAFVAHAKCNSVMVNFYYGDAVIFCYELAACTSPPTWKDLPLFFNVIGTSSLVDWVGMSNILLPTSQILAHKSTSILHTETFRLVAKEPDDDLYESLFMDVDLASLIIGLAPVYG